MLLGIGLRYKLHLFLGYNDDSLFPFSLDVSSPFHRGLSTLYSLPGCILAFHLEG